MEIACEVHSDAVTAMLDGMASRCKLDDSDKPELTTILQEDVENQFELEGDPAWTEDSPAWAAYKESVGASLKVGEFTGELKESYGHDGEVGAGGYVTMDDESIVLGSDVEHADRFFGGDEGDPRFSIPARPLHVTSITTENAVKYLELKIVGKNGE